MTALKACLSVASLHWANRSALASRKPSEMATFARVCVETLGDARRAETLRPADAVTLLAKLREKRSPATVKAYYGAFRTMLKLNGVLTHDWPAAPTPPRSTRAAIGSAGLEDCLRWLDENGAHPTRDLATLLVHTGLRVSSEALDPSALVISEEGAYTLLGVQGKGGHRRNVPCVNPEARSILQDGGRLHSIRSTPYRSHLNAWRRATTATGLKSKLATLHALRHQYACDAYRKSGGNLIMVQALLGHSDPKTTARYVHQDDLNEQARALASP